MRLGDLLSVIFFKKLLMIKKISKVLKFITLNTMKLLKQTYSFGEDNVVYSM